MNKRTVSAQCRCGTLAAFLCSLAIFLSGCGKQNDVSHLRRCDTSHAGLRIVSMAPNTTEILYALGLGSNVVGVSRYTVYPPEALDKPKVGGTYDPNYEMIMVLQPDIVIGLDTQKDIAAQLSALGIKFLGVSHERVDEILQSILTIGKTCGAEAQAKQLFQTLENKAGQASSLSVVKPSDSRQTGSLSYSQKPKVLVCVGHDEALTRMYVAGRNTFYDDLIQMAGGTNACEEATQKYPEISPEGLAAIQPDVIIDIFPNIGKTRPDFSNVWKDSRTVTITNDYASIPGPRFVLLLEDFITAIYPTAESK